jgi:hypothetical protein
MEYGDENDEYGSDEVSIQVLNLVPETQSITIIKELLKA